MAYEGAVRLGAFMGVLTLMAALEAVFPRRQRVEPRGGRWVTNLFLSLIDALALRFVLPIAAMGMALTANANGWGLLNHVEWPAWFETLLAIVALDMLVYWQHVASHKIPLFWRFHKVHHADRDIDVTTGIRFHPVEILVSMVYKVVCVGLLGPSVLAVLVFEVILNACALFNHANVRLPLALDRVLRAFIVTPDMHRVHHSAVICETNSNYGFSLSIWDKVFGSYLAQPNAGHSGMTIGLAEYSDHRPRTLAWCLSAPFRKK